MSYAYDIRYYSKRSLLPRAKFISDARYGIPVFFWWDSTPTKNVLHIHFYVCIYLLINLLIAQQGHCRFSLKRFFLSKNMGAPAGLFSVFKLI